ncbi:non structural polyprotein nsP123 [Whataroa virus]|uniref:Polyprotein P1234 n=6 Tax=Whataroa virus TaxID=48543 RepID=H6SU08_9VIRU|nr:non structural polyprotein nsP123 [Whataroa virus]AEJ36238.1 non structural polyprotein [Whataroa virus]
MEKPVVNVDVDPQSPFVAQLQKSFPQFEVVAQQATPNDHANARAFSHLASKLIELEVPTTATILDIGSAPARRMFSEHQYHCVCPMRSPEDPDRMMKYAAKLAEKAGSITNKKLYEKIRDLRTVLDTPDQETPSICFHNDVTCATRAEVSVMQDVYINAPATIYHQAMKGVRTLYWIGFDTTQFMFSAMAGSYPAYNTNWADEKVLEARNIGLCSTKLSEGRVGKLSIMRKKSLKPGTQVYFSVGSTLYPENRANLQSWHLPSVFHLKGKQPYTCRCDTVVSCEGYVVKKVTISPGITGETVGYAVTNNSEGFLLCKVTDTVKGERVSFPVCTYIPATICDQMTGIMATDINPDDAQKLLVGLNQRIVINGKTNRNTNTMQNYLLPIIAQGFSKWAKERKEDLDNEKLLGVRERKLAFGCLWAFRTKKIHSFYRPPGTQTIVKVPASFSAFPLSSVWTTSLPMSFRQKIKLMIKDKNEEKLLAIPKEVEDNAKFAQQEATETARAEELRKALPPLVADKNIDASAEVICEVEGLDNDIGAALVETPRGHVKIIAQDTDKLIGKYIVVSPIAVLKNQKLSPVHPLAEQVKIITHSGRTGRYAVEPYDAKVLMPSGAAVPWPEFLALSESATLVFNEREFINRKLYHIAVHGPAKNTEEEQYKAMRAEAADTEYVFDVDKKKCVKREEASGLVLVGELTNPPYHEMALEGLKTRPAVPYKVETIGVIGTPGSGKSAIIKNIVTTRDLVTSGKKENCREIEADVLKHRKMQIVSKTVDSVLLNGCHKSVDILYVDEAYACHAGTLLALIAIVRPRNKVVLCGDPKQCGFFNMMQLKVHFNDPERDICTKTFYKYISRRCTQPVTAIVSTLHYNGKMRTTNPCNKNIVIDITGQTKPKPGDIILTCFRGWVKQLQIEYPGHEVMTAAASQGLTRKGVFAVRQKVNENPLYAITSEHVNVLLTRTEDRIVWKTLQGDPWIKQLTNIPKGNFHATVEEWEAEHKGIMEAITSPAPRSNPFSCKTNVCWAKALEPILSTAGISLTGCQWADLFPQFEDDKPHSAIYALDVICVKFFGMDLTSGIFSKPLIPLTYHPAEGDRKTAHWDNSPGQRKYGFDKAVVAELSRRFPVFCMADKGVQLDVQTGRTRVVSSRFNLVPFNRNLPHSLVPEYKTQTPGQLSAFIRQFKQNTILLVSETPAEHSTKSVEWIAPLGTLGATKCYNLAFGFPPQSRYDLVIINIGTKFRHHHYQQCEDHAATMKTLSRSALNCLNPGGTLVVKAYGYADRNSEDIITALARKFVRVSAARPQCVSSNTEMYFIFRQLDNSRTRQFTPHHLNCVVSSVYEGTRDGVGAAPSYKSRRGNIIECTEEAVVNAANALGRPGEGVCKAIYKKWPNSFTGSATEVGTAKMTTSLGKKVIHAVGPDFKKHSEEEALKLLQNAYHAIADIINENNIKSVAIPLLSTGIYAAGKDRLETSLHCLTTAMDRTDADVTVYCLDKKWQQRIDAVLRLKEEVTELKDDDMEIDEELVWIHPDSCLKGRKGFSTTKGKLYSYFEGTKFHQAAKDMAEINVLFPDTIEANEQICMYILGESMEAIREKCPVDYNPSSSPPKTLPCLCMYAMTPERVHRLRSNNVKEITVCSSTPLPKHKIKNVQRIQCSKIVLFNPQTPAFVPARKFIETEPKETEDDAAQPDPTPAVQASVSTPVPQRQQDPLELIISADSLTEVNDTSDDISDIPFDTSVYASTSSLSSVLDCHNVVEVEAEIHVVPQTPVAPPRKKKLARLAALSRASSISSIESNPPITFGSFEDGEIDNLQKKCTSEPFMFGSFEPGEVNSLIETRSEPPRRGRRRRNKNRQEY